MRIPWVLLLSLLVLSVTSDLYIYRCLKSGFPNRSYRKIHVLISLLCYAALVIAILLPRKDGDNGMLLTVMWLLYSFATVYVAKYVFVILDILGRLLSRLIRSGARIATIISSIIGLTVFVGMWWGALINRFNIDVKHVEIVRDELPKGFDGYKIVQISDLHTGTFGNDTTFLSELVSVVNAQSPDLIVFTGDIVNSRSSELTPHTSTLSRLRARDGVYSIMGNHDYGDYANWDSKQQKEESIEYLKAMQDEMGWKMLNNRYVYIYNDGDSIALIGVENIGDHPFPIYGSLIAAYPSLDDDKFKILLTHNPAHWCDSISGNKNINVALSLAGHTHAMQMEIGGISPAALRYPTWGGLYADTDSTHLLYVNIGAGTVGMPARIGATPEVTLFTLRSGNDSTHK